jgi:hypothetical protein
MGLIEPLTLSAAALPSSVLRLDSALLLSVPLVSALSVAALGLWFARLRRQQRPRRLLQLQSTAA